MDYNKAWSKFSHQISANCEHFNEQNRQRKRRIGALEVVHGVLRLKASAHESYRSIFSDFDNPFAASSFCEARARFPAELFAQIRCDLLSKYEAMCVEVPKYKSHRVFAIDGSIINLPSLLKNQGFHQAPGNHYPQGLVSILFNVLNRTICGLNFSSNHCERKAASELSASLEPGDILLGDKGYLSFGFLCELSERGLSAVFAVQQGQTFKEIVAFRESNLTEDTVTIDPSKQTYQNARARHPGVDLLPQKLRLIKFQLGSSIEVLATTIFDENFKASEIADLYWLRWRIEELYKVFKCTLNIENFHSKSANGVEQELHAASILWNYSRFLESYIPEKAFKVATRSKTSPYQVNFTQTLAAVRENLNMLLFGWGRKLHEAIERCIRRIVRTLLPVRPGRQNERKSKKPPNKWFTSKKERQRNSGDRKVSA